MQPIQKFSTALLLIALNFNIALAGTTFQKSTIATPVAVTNGGTGLTSITQGYTLFSSAGNTLSATSNIFVEAGGDIGIGTTDPNGKLDIRGTVCLNGGADCRSTWPSSDTNIWTVTGNDTYYNTGNVGIGTTAPTEPLHIHAADGASQFRMTDAVTGATTGDGLLFSLDASQAAYMWNYENTNIIFGTNNAQRMTIDNTGNVGIGTTAPGAKLVLGTAGDILGLGSNDIEAWTNLSGAVESRDSSIFFGNDTDTWYNSNAYYAGGWKYKTTDLAASMGMYKGEISFKVAGSGTADNAIGFTEAMRIQNDGDVEINSGNVGIGTTAPGQKLHVDTGHIALSDDYRLVWGNGNTDVSILGNVASDYLRFFTSASEQMRIDSSGNVGIGTAAPDSARKLTLREATGVSAGISFRDTDEAEYAEIGMARTADDLLTGTANIDLVITTTNDGNNLIFGTNTAERMRILPSGRVGIGQTSPGVSLEVAKSADWAQTEISTWSTTDTQYSNLILQKSASATINTGAGTAANEDLGGISARGFNSSNSSDLAGRILFEGDAAPDADAVPGRISFWTSDAATLQERMRIDDGGNVGIGTTAPGQNLHIDAADGRLLVTDSVDASGNRVMLGDDSGNGGFLNIYDESEAVKIYLSATASSFFNNGNVGIGTTAPGHKLSLRTNAAIHLGYNSTAAGIEVGRITSNSYDVNNTGYSLAEMVFSTVDTGYFGQIQFRTNSVNSTNTRAPVRMTLDKSGNLGIGTTAPATKLDVNGDGTVRGKLNITTTQTLALNVTGATTGTSYGTFNNTGGNLLWGIERSTGGGLFSGSTAYAGVIGTQTSDVFQFATNNSIKMTLDTSGNVGIGTTAPTGKLNLGYTTSQVPRTYTNGGNEGLVINADRDDVANYLGTVDFVAGRASDADNGGTQFRFITQPRSTGAPAVAMLIDKSGNVGIGTTSPYDKLEIGSGGNIALRGTGIFKAAESSSYRLGFNSGTNVELNSGSYIKFGTDAAGEAMRIISSGNVGIGTTSPGNYKLMVNGPTYLGDGAYVGGSHRINLEVAQGTGVLTVSGYGGGSSNDTALFYGVSGASGSATATAMRVNTNSSTGRSINAGGTINASGADYAEYENKRADVGAIDKGDLIGFDSEGQITDKYSLAVSFGIVSTDPAYVGGDTWGGEDMLDMDHEEGEEGYEQELAERLAIAESKVERIAYSGKVPCNIEGGQPGDFLIPTAGLFDSINGEYVATPTIEELYQSVGRVRNVNNDGKPIIAVNQ
jgi:hypothetical protein